MTLNDTARDALPFYQEVLEILNGSKIPFMIGGSYASFHYTGASRKTKDMDVYCKPVDYPSLLKLFAAEGYTTELTDIRWLAKIWKDNYFVDIIFDTVSNICKVDDRWFDRAQKSELFGHEVLVIAVEDLIWGKIYVQNRERYDGAEINHLFLKQGKNINWKYLSESIEPHWHLLLSAFILFQFVYPHDFPEIIPKDLFFSLMARAHEQYELPAVTERVCRGPLIDQTQYQVDIMEWGYKSYTIKSI